MDSVKSKPIGSPLTFFQFFFVFKLGLFFEGLYVGLAAVQKHSKFPQLSEKVGIIEVHWGLHIKKLVQSRVSKLRLVSSEVTTFSVNQVHKWPQKGLLIEVKCQVKCGKWYMDDRTSKIGGIFEGVICRRVKELRISSKKAIFLRLIVRQLIFFSWN